jgi:N-formylglutamate amidohydrolase
VAEIQARIDRCYTPYHERLERLIAETHYSFGQVWHIDCHSMPASSSGGADFVLGDRDGRSCAPAFTNAVYDFLRGLGYRVTVNNPYKGMEILRRHGDPARGRHSLQLEIGKALYWDEEKSEKSTRYGALKTDIEKLLSFCADYIDGQLSMALAAD